MIYGGWEPELHALMAKYVKPGDVAYDLGANFGIFTIFLARLVGPEGRVYAFEPLPHTMADLKANVERNDLRNVEYAAYAVADTVGRARFHIGSQLGSGHLDSTDHLHPKKGEAVDVPVTTLDEFVSKGNRPPQFLKIDVEGAEGAVLAGGRTVLNKHRPILAIEVHSAEQGNAVGSVLRDENYRVWRVDLGMTPVTRMTDGGLSAEGLCGFVLAMPGERVDAGQGPQPKGVK